MASFGLCADDEVYAESVAGLPDESNLISSLASLAPMVL